MRRLLAYVGVLMGAVTVLTVAPAVATPLTNSQIFSQFNAVIFGNFTSSSDVEGRTVVGGNLTGGGSFDIKQGSAAASAFAPLTVYGSSTGTGTYNMTSGSGLTILGSNSAGFNLGPGGTVYIGGANSGALSTSGGPTTMQINGNNNAPLTENGGGTIQVKGNSNGIISGGALTYTGTQSGNLNGGATATRVSSMTLTPPSSTVGGFASTFQTQLTSLSAQLNGVAPNSTATLANSTLTFNSAPNSSGVAVFDVNSSQFTNNTNIKLNIAGATSIIINVNVDSCVQTACAFTFPNTMSFGDFTGYASAILWNFVNATGLTFPNEFGGSVLAPLAGVSNGNAIDGTLVAASFTGNGELHSRPYTGVFPGTATPAPEPASLAVIASGLAGLAAIRRRRKSRT